MALRGRPKTFKNKTELESLIDEFLDYCKPHPIPGWVTEAKRLKRTTKYEIVQRQVLSKEVPITINNLCAFMGIHRDTFNDYSHKKQFSDTIKRFKQVCEAYAEDQLYSGNASGAKFSLQNNYGWRDETEVKHSGEINRNMTDEELDAIIERSERRQISKDN
jgi:hypothetical protein